MLQIWHENHTYSKIVSFVTPIYHTTHFAAQKLRALVVSRDQVHHVIFVQLAKCEETTAWHHTSPLTFFAESHRKHVSQLAMISWSDLESAWKTSTHQWTTSINLFLIHTPSNNHWEPIGNPLGTIKWVLPKNHAGSRCSATLLLKKLTQLCPQRSWQTWCVRLSETNFVNFVKQTKSLLKMLKRIWSGFDKTCSVSWQRRTSWHGQTPFWKTTKFQSEKKCSNQRCSEHNTSDHPYVSCRSQIASCRDVRNHSYSFGCTHQLVTSWSPADHQPPRGLWGGPFTLSPVSDISDVSHGLSCVCV